jgi:hypothetical protein
MATHFSGPVVSPGGFIGDVTPTGAGSDMSGTMAGNDVAGAQVGLRYDPAAPTAYSGSNLANRTIDPGIAVASLTKASAETAYTVAAPGATGAYKFLTVYSATAYAHVVTVTGLLGGTTLTLTAGTIGLSFTLYGISLTQWVVIHKHGATQTA